MKNRKDLSDLKNIIIISISIFAFVLSLFNVTYAFFNDSKNQPMSIKSSSSFGESTVYDLNLFIEGNLTTTTKIKNNQPISYSKDNVENNDYLLTIATQVEPHTTEYELDEYTSISYEIYHKTDETLDTSSFTCTDNKYNNGTKEDYCNTGTFIENSLEGLPFELIKDFRIKDTNTHYFDAYIYLNNDTTSKKLKTRIFYLDKEVERPVEPNAPEIDNTGLVPIKYNETSGKWVVTTQDDPEWYDYDRQKWANAASIKSGVITESNPYPELTVPDGTSTNSDVYAMFVWIPRYSYTIGCTSSSSCLGYKIEGASDLALETPGAIDVKFVNIKTKETYTGDSPVYTYTTDSNGMPTDDRNPINWYTHPAFDFGGKQLSGIWVGKFETTGSEKQPTILPNVSSLLSKKISVQFSTAQKFISENYMYGLIGDSHMMKNREWAVVAYLSQSIYGKYGNSLYTQTNKEVYINNYSNYYTGISSGQTVVSSTSKITCRYNDITNRGSGTGACGSGASTTGNIYGIYDMSGGAYEYVMGNYNNIIGKSEFDASWFTIEQNIKYYDKFTMANPNSIKSSETIGYGFVETGQWYNDIIDSYTDSTPWVLRGGQYNKSKNAGVFNFHDYSGSNLGISGDGFRVVIVAP